MKKIIPKIILIFIFTISTLAAKTDFFNEGVNLFNNKKFEEARFKFEQNIVYNPKSEQSYLYLSKIFNKLEKKELEELENSEEWKEVVEELQAKAGEAREIQEKTKAKVTPGSTAKTVKEERREPYVLEIGDAIGPDSFGVFG